MRDPCILTALLIVTYYLLISGGPGASGRFRHPAMPIISILAGYGLFSYRSHPASEERMVRH